MVRGKISLSANALGEKFGHDTDITIRPASPLQKVSGSGSLDGGQSKNIEMGISSFIPSSVDAKLVVSRSPLVEFSKDLDYLLRYPYGCVEQTVSSVFPQIYYQDLVKDLLKKENKSANPNYNIQEAIKKLQLMQLYNGGLTYWPGQGYESWWGSVYAAHFLYEAKKAGFEVDDTMLSKLMDYLKAKLKEKKTIQYYYNGNLKKAIAPKEVAYSLYVLALAGETNISIMNYYKSKRNELSLDSKYLLATAYYLAGDQESYRNLLPKSFEGERSNSVFGGSFYSYLRDEAIALNALLEVDPNNPQVGIMARHVSQQLKNKRYINTQERSFSFLAMGKIARQAASSTATATIKAGSSKVGDFNGKLLAVSSDKMKQGKLSIDAKGSGKLYYFWEAEGISADGSYKAVDNFLKVRKTFYNRFGQRITNNRFKQNDLVVVKLSINGTTNARVENVVMADILPAGFEIENARLTDVPELSWIKDKSIPQYEDIRDDRINMFVEVTGTVRHYYYLVRAVSKGVFQMGPVGADAMYNGEYHSYSGGGVIRVTE